MHVREIARGGGGGGGGVLSHSSLVFLHFITETDADAGDEYRLTVSPMRTCRQRAGKEGCPMTSRLPLGPMDALCARAR